MRESLPKIVLAAVLKPINDTRMFEKFAQSLAGEYEVHIIGFEAEVPDIFPQAIHFHPIFKFDRKEHSRWNASQLFLKTLDQLNPDFLIIHAVELLPAACWYSIKKRIPLCYDVRENYWRNIIYQDHYPNLIKLPLAIGVRSLEYCSRFVVKLYFLAERNYEQEFRFSRGKSTILENKFKVLLTHLPAKVPNEIMHFVYTGTISVIYGAKEAFELMEQLVSTGFKLKFTMLGKIADVTLGNWLAQKATQYSWFFWKGATQSIPHPAIIALLAQADSALLPYQPNKSTENCIPTKLYECLALGVPMIIQQNDLWESSCQAHQAALFIDYCQPNVHELIKQLTAMNFYPNGAVKAAEWQKEATDLRHIIQSLQ